MSRPPSPYRTWAAWAASRQRPGSAPGRARLARAPFMPVDAPGTYLVAVAPSHRVADIVTYRPEAPRRLQWDPDPGPQFWEFVAEFGLRGVVVAGPFPDVFAAAQWHQRLMDTAEDGDPTGAWLAEARAARDAAPFESPAWEWWNAAYERMRENSTPLARFEADQQYKEFWAPMIRARQFRGGHG